MNELIFADIGSLIFLITISVLIVALVALFIDTLNFRQSKKYRRFLTDMYVSSKIRLLANKDGLNITEEERFFKDWNKKNKKVDTEYNLDDAVEEKLIEKIEEPIKKSGR